MLYYVLSFVSGFLVKIVDWIEDDLKKPMLARWPIAIAAGIIIGYLISVSSFSNLFLAALFAQVFAKKIDKASHAATTLAAVAVFILLGINGFELWHFLIFLVPAFLDELEFPGSYSWITEYRMLLNVTALAFGALIGKWDYLFGILSFDVGYFMFKHFSEDMTEKRESKTAKQQQGDRKPKRKKVVG